MRRYILKKLSPALAGAALLAVAGPAVAASSSCRILPNNGKCETGTVRANPSGHFLFFEVGPHSNYKVKDEQTRKVVRTGTSGWTGKRGTIFGLYGDEYKLYVENPVTGYGYISNS